MNAWWLNDGRWPDPLPLEYRTRIARGQKISEELAMTNPRNLHVLSSSVHVVGFRSVSGSERLLECASKCARFIMN